jgi:hypothetical protein
MKTSAPLKQAMKSITLSPTNSLLFVSDIDGGTPPEPVRGPMILSTSSCISFRCLPEPDGATEVVLGDAHEVDPGVSPTFDAELETPHRTMIITTVENRTLLRSSVSDTRTRVRIWLSHPQWPDKVIVGLN